MSKIGNVLTVVLFAFVALIVGWFDGYHLLIGIPTLIAIMIILYCLRRRAGVVNTSSRKVSVDDVWGTGSQTDTTQTSTAREDLVRNIVFGVIQGLIVVLLILPMMFWGCGKTFVYGIFYDRNFQNLYSDIQSWQKVPSISSYEKIVSTCEDENLKFSKGNRYLLAQEEYKALLGWGDLLRGEQAIENYQKAAALAIKWKFLDNNSEDKIRAAQLWIELEQAKHGPRELPAGAQITVTGIDTSGFPSAITARVNVNDAEGNAIPWLEKRDFVIQNDEQDINFSFATSAEKAKLNVAVAMDTSGSVKGDPLVQGKRGVKQFINQLGLQDQVELIAFSSSPLRKVTWTLERDTLYAAIENLAASGETAIYDTVAMAIEDLKKVEGERAIILCTDGGDTMSKISATEMIMLVEQAGIPIYILGLKTKELDVETMRMIANESGGEYFEATEPTELITLYLKAGAKIKSGYKISISPSWPPGQHAGTHSLKVLVGSNPLVAERSYDL